MKVARDLDAKARATFTDDQALAPILELRLFSADWHPQGGCGRWRGWWLRLPGGRSLV
jgi:hypothetical protein